MRKIKESAAASFAVVAVVYAIAVVVGVLVYYAVPADWWLRLLIADVAATVATFIFSVIFKNASVYDPYWSVAPPVILISFAFGRALTALGVLILTAVGFWAVRLTANWAYNFGDLTHQDWRYTMLKEKTGAFYPLINFIGIHLVPTLVVYGCILPAVFAIREGVEAGPLGVIFVAISMLAATLQCVSDIQMHAFRRRRRGGFIRDGLWKYSRHPNYLGEILMWWGIGLAVVVSAPEVWYFIFGALANTALFLFVSIPMADGRQSKKDGFAEYKSATRMLLPIPK
ncbi:MAG: DUF1295 domain-containing protein [Clostridia bacterium]|nr:DUF1295 domain-containing protein [Clostridia bacterium]